jgi:hypothetical protein
MAKKLSQNAECHSEHSEESHISDDQTLRFAQGDSFEIFSKSTISVCVLMLSASCLLVMSANSHKAPIQNSDILTIFITGNELGALKPCGCSGGQLGGLDRRSAVFDSVPKHRRLIIDTGSFVENDSEQNLIKFGIIVEAFNLLDYDVVHLKEKDVEIAKHLGLLGNLNVAYHIISNYQASDIELSAKFTKSYPLKDNSITITVAASDINPDQMEQISNLFERRHSEQTLNILIVSHCNTDIIESIAQNAPVVDCIICPADSDEPKIINDPNNGPLVFSVGRLGKYVTGLKIYPPDENSTGSKEALYALNNGITLAFSAIPVIEDLPQQQALVKLYKSYQQLVKDSHLLETYPRFTLPSGSKYVGSKSCKYCHFFEYEMCADYPHADAYATLEEVGSQFDPECIICHVIGLEYESGYYSEQTTPHLKNVGCENCHGPGFRHVVTYGLEKTVEPKSNCIDCHTPDHSTEYAGNEQDYLEKINHWVELNDPCNVKNNGGSKGLW